MSDHTETTLVEVRGRFVFTGEQARMLVEAERRNAAFRPFERAQFERMRQKADDELNRMLGLPDSHTQEADMVEKARCKFAVEEVAHRTYGKQVTLRATYDGPLSDEDEAFSKATPSGELKFELDNPALDGFFEPGREFYVDLIPVDGTSD